MPTVRDVTIALMRELGMTTVFGNPGSTELPMFRNWPADFRYVMGLQESVVLGMADGFAQGTRRAALVNLHSSAGVGHALGNLFTAYKNQTPLVVTAGQQARSILPYEPFLFAERRHRISPAFREVGLRAGPRCRMCQPRCIERAYHVAMEPPYGPTFVSIPIDDWDRAVRAFHTPRAASMRCGCRAAWCTSTIAAGADALARGLQRPAIVVGAGVARDGAWDAGDCAGRAASRRRCGLRRVSARCSFPENQPAVCRVPDGGARGDCRRHLQSTISCWRWAGR